MEHRLLVQTHPLQMVVAQMLVFGSDDPLLGLNLNVKDAPQSLLLDQLLRVKLDLLVDQLLQVVLQLVLQSDARAQRFLRIHVSLSSLSLLIRIYLANFLLCFLRQD